MRDRRDREKRKDGVIEGGMEERKERWKERGKR